MREQYMLRIARLQQCQHGFKQRGLWMPMLGAYCVKFDICSPPGGFNMKGAVRLGVRVHPDKATQVMSLSFEDVQFPTCGGTTDRMAGDHSAGLPACQCCRF